MNSRYEPTIECSLARMLDGCFFAACGLATALAGGVGWVLYGIATG